MATQIAMPHRRRSHRPRRHNGGHGYVPAPWQYAGPAFPPSAPGYPFVGHPVGGYVGQAPLSTSWVATPPVVVGAADTSVSEAAAAAAAEEPIATATATATDEAAPVASLGDNGLEQTFAGKNIIVTGGSSGIGKDAALSFHARGGTVVIMSRTQSKLDDVLANDFAGSPRAMAVAYDAGDNASIAEGIATALGLFGGDGALHVLVNSTGGYSVGETIGETAQGMYQLNTTSALVAIDAAKEALIAGGGSVVNISSIAAAVGGQDDYSMLYGMAKAAQDLLTKTMALRLAPDGVRVNTVMPGVIATPAFAPLCVDGKTMDDVLSDYAPKHPMGRVGQPKETSAAIVFLASDAASFITGQILAVDGGVTVTSRFTMPDEE